MHCINRRYTPMSGYRGISRYRGVPPGVYPDVGGIPRYRDYTPRKGGIPRHQENCFTSPLGTPTNLDFRFWCLFLLLVENAHTHTHTVVNIHDNASGTRHSTLRTLADLDFHIFVAGCLLLGFESTMYSNPMNIFPADPPLILGPLVILHF